jgi:hypothetical protein
MPTGLRRLRHALGDNPTTTENLLFSNSKQAGHSPMPNVYNFRLIDWLSHQSPMHLFVGSSKRKQSG